MNMHPLNSLTFYITPNAPSSAAVLIPALGGRVTCSPAGHHNVISGAWSPALAAAHPKKPLIHSSWLELCLLHERLIPLLEGVTSTAGGDGLVRDDGSRIPVLTLPHAAWALYAAAPSPASTLQPASNDANVTVEEGEDDDDGDGGVPAPPAAAVAPLSLPCSGWGGEEPRVQPSVGDAPLATLPSPMRRESELLGLSLGRESELQLPGDGGSQRLLHSPPAAGDARLPSEEGRADSRPNGPVAAPYTPAASAAAAAAAVPTESPSSSMRGPGAPLPTSHKRPRSDSPFSAEQRTPLPPTSGESSVGSGGSGGGAAGNAATAVKSLIGSSGATTAPPSPHAIILPGVVVAANIPTVLTPAAAAATTARWRPSSRAAARVYEAWLPRMLVQRYPEWSAADAFQLCYRPVPPAQPGGKGGGHVWFMGAAETLLAAGLGYVLTRGAVEDALGAALRKAEDPAAAAAFTPALNEALRVLGALR